MTHKQMIIATVVFVLIIAGMFTYTYLKRSELATQYKVEETPKTTSQTSDPYKEITRIDAKHFFNNNKHTLVGEVVLPTPCDLLNWDPVVRESMPEQVTVNFSVVNSTQTCEQKPTTQRFNVVFSGSRDAHIDATLNGRHIELNLLTPEQGETPEEYEIFLKG